MKQERVLTLAWMLNDLVWACTHGPLGIAVALVA